MHATLVKQQTNKYHTQQGLTKLRVIIFKEHSPIWANAAMCFTVAHYCQLHDAHVNGLTSAEFHYMLTL